MWCGQSQVLELRKSNLKPKQLLLLYFNTMGDFE